MSIPAPEEPARQARYPHLGVTSLNSPANPVTFWPAFDLPSSDGSATPDRVTQSVGPAASGCLGSVVVAW